MRSNSQRETRMIARANGSYVHRQGNGGWKHENGKWQHYCADCAKPNGHGLRCKSCSESLSLKIMTEKVTVLAAKQDRSEFVRVKVSAKRKTELMAANQWKFTPIDKPLWPGGPTRGDLLADNLGLSPVECLIAKEESSERQGLQHDRRKFKKFTQATSPLVPFPEIPLAK